MGTQPLSKSTQFAILHTGLSGKLDVLKTSLQEVLECGQDLAALFVDIDAELAILDNYRTFAAELKAAYGASAVPALHSITEALIFVEKKGRVGPFLVVAKGSTEPTPAPVAEAPAETNIAGDFAGLIVTERPAPAAAEQPTEVAATPAAELPLATIQLDPAMVSEAFMINSVAADLEISGDAMIKAVCVQSNLQRMHDEFMQMAEVGKNFDADVIAIALARALDPSWNSKYRFFGPPEPEVALAAGQ